MRHTNTHINAANFADFKCHLQMLDTCQLCTASSRCLFDCVSISSCSFALSDVAAAPTATQMLSMGTSLTVHTLFANLFNMPTTGYDAGDIEKDFWYAFDLLRSSKDHVEFTLVRDFVRDALAEVCSQVRVDTEKSVLKQGAVQHLYGRLSGQLQPDANDAKLLVRPQQTVQPCVTQSSFLCSMYRSNFTSLW